MWDFAFFFNFYFLLNISHTFTLYPYQKEDMILNILYSHLRIEPTIVALIVHAVPLRHDDPLLNISLLYATKFKRSQTFN